MARRAANPELFADLTFPVHGLQRSTEVNAQPLGTTPIGVNVRACDPGTMRLRGGQRAGLSKFISTKPGGTNVIQHLDVIVDPTTAALFQLTPNPEASEADPRIPGSYVPTGGTGAQPNPNNPWPLDQEEEGGWELVQVTADDFSINAPGSTVQVAFAQNVTAGDLLLVAAENSDTTSSSYLDEVTDSQGNTYTRIHAVDGTNGVIFRAIAGSTGACTVNAAFVVGAGTLYTVVGIAQYSGNHAAPGDGNSDNSDNDTALSTGSITVSQANSLVVGVFFLSRIIGSEPAIPALSPGSGMNERMESSFTNGTFDAKIGWYDAVVDAASAVTATAASAYLYTGAGASFKPA